MLLLNNLGSNTLLLSPTSNSKSINSENPPHNLAISPDDKQDSKDNGGKDGKDTDRATWHSTTSTLASPSSSTSTLVPRPRSISHHTDGVSVSFYNLTTKLSHALPRVKLSNTDHLSSSSSSTDSLSSTSHLLTTPATHKTSTPPFRNIYDYSQGPRPLKLKLQFHP